MRLEFGLLRTGGPGRGRRGLYSAGGWGGRGLETRVGEGDGDGLASARGKRKRGLVGECWWRQSARGASPGSTCGFVSGVGDVACELSRCWGRVRVTRGWLRCVGAVVCAWEVARLGFPFGTRRRGEDWRMQLAEPRHGKCVRSLAILQGARRVCAGRPGCGALHLRAE